MAKQSLTISDLERELAKKQQRLSKLEDKQEDLAKQLADVDAEIAKITGESTPGGARTPRRKKTTRRRKAASGARKRRSGRPLTDYIKKVLAKSDEPMRIKDIAPAVQDAGYKSASKDFYGLVAAALRDPAFKKVGRGVYTVASGASIGGSKKKSKKKRKSSAKSAKKAAAKAPEAPSQQS